MGGEAGWSGSEGSLLATEAFGLSWAPGITRRGRQVGCAAERRRPGGARDEAESASGGPGTGPSVLLPLRAVGTQRRGCREPRHIPSFLHVRRQSPLSPVRSHCQAPPEGDPPSERAVEGAWGGVRLCPWPARRLWPPSPWPGVVPARGSGAGCALGDCVIGNKTT